MDKNGMMTPLQQHNEEVLERQKAAIAEDKVVPLKVVDRQKLAQSNSSVVESLADRVNIHKRKK